MEDIKRIKNRIDWFCDNKINAFSPTISPAPKNVERKEIESIYEGVKYYVKNGINELIFQKKYMGSYCDIYLSKNLEETYFVSRNGFKINHIETEKAIEACKNLHNQMNWENISMYIIQSELMPWGVLGKGLIENEFEGYLNAHQNHFEYLQNSNLYSKIEKVKDSEDYKKYIQFKVKNDEKALKKQYPSHIIRQFNSLEEFKIIELETYKKGIEIYKNQIEHFGKNEDVYFKPFNILKIIYNNGIEEIVNDNLSYKKVNSDEFLTVKINSIEEIDAKINPVYNWFETLTNSNEEGIMIKPLKSFIKGIAPAFKVRNNNYLTMIYGVNFIYELESNIEKRKINKKLECSINDWMLNWQLLKVNYQDINRENYHLKNLVLDRIYGETEENTLDTRL